MYAVVEFMKGEDRTCAVIPLLWLVDNNTRCYWPRKATDKLFNKAVERRTPYAKTWAIYSVHRVLDTNVDCEATMDRLKEIVDTGTSEDGGLTTHSITMQPLTANTEENQVESENVVNEIENEDGNSEMESQIENLEAETGRKRTHSSSTQSYDTENPTRPWRKHGKHKRHRHRKSKSKKTKHNSSKQPLSSQDSSSQSDDSRKDDHHFTVLGSSSANHINFQEDDHHFIARSGSSTNHKNSRKDDDHFTAQGGSSANRNNSRGDNDYSNVLSTSSQFDRTLGSKKGGCAGNSRSGGSIPDRYITPRRLADHFPDNSSIFLTPPLNHNPPTPRTASGKNPPIRPMDNRAFQEEVLKRLQQLTDEQVQQHQLISQILITLEASLEPNKKPAGMPDLPLKDMDSFYAFEEFLQSEVNFQYLKTRLSSIGGTCQRGSVMGMLRFLLTNNVAMKFNWAGQNNKISFKGVKVMAAIMDAAKVQFKGKHSSDKFIIDAVQRWLKLAKSRYLYELGKKQ